MNQSPEAIEAEPSQAVTVCNGGELVPATAIDRGREQTPAQARIDAVSNLLHKSIERASTLELAPEQVKTLKADFPDEAFKLGAGGNPDLIYIEHAYLRDRFDEVIGMGRWSLIRSRPQWAEEFTTNKGGKAVRVYADCALLIHGCYCSEAIGTMVYYPNNNTQDYSDAAEGAETAAFRRCAKKIGVGLQAWKKDFCAGWQARNRGGKRPTQAPEPPIRPQTPAKPQNAPKANPAPKRGTSAPAPAAPAKPRPMPTEEQRQKLPGALHAVIGLEHEKIDEYLSAIGWLLENAEKLEEIELRFVPATRQEFDKLCLAIKAFQDGGEAVVPYGPHWGAEDAPAAKPKPTRQNVPHGTAIQPEIVDERPRTQGVIQQVTLKEGKKKDGSGWSLWGIKVANDSTPAGEAQWHNTFSNTLGQFAQKRKGQTVTVIYKEDEEGRRTALELIAADGTKAHQDSGEG